MSTVDCMAGEPQIQQGSDGEWVEYLQQLLINEGIDTGPVDGIFGPLTDAAVREYQEREGLEVDGIVGPITWGQIVGDGTSDPDPAEQRESVTVEHSITLVLQTDDETCWAASTAMMLGRDDDREIVREVTGEDPDDAENDSVSQVELAQVASHYGFSQVYPVCQDAFGWAEWVAEGPLLIQIPGGTHHSVVVAGIFASGDENEAQSLMLIYDPIRGANWLPFDEANAAYELAGEDWVNNVYRN